jgi:hypothetical protein
MITEREATYSTKQGFPAELPPSATLLRIANIVGMTFELQQVIYDTTLDSYVLRHHGRGRHIVASSPSSCGSVEKSWSSSQLKAS